MIKGEKDIHEKIEYIKKIDNDDNLYNSILQRPIFVNGNYNDIEKKIENEQSSFIDDIFTRKK